MKARQGAIILDFKLTHYQLFRDTCFRPGILHLVQTCAGNFMPAARRLR